MKLRIPRRNWRTPTTLAVAMAAAVGTGTGVLTTISTTSGATPATSPAAYNAKTAQGGCHTYDAGGLSGFNIGVCTNDGATGTTAYPDIYINTARQLGANESCKIDIETWDDHNHKLGDTTTDCALGHHSASPVKPTTAAMVHTFARLWFNNSSYPTGDSPSASLAPNATAGIPIAGSDPVTAALTATRQVTTWPTYPPKAMAADLISRIEKLTDNDLDRYLTSIPRGDLDRLNTYLDSYFKGQVPSGRMNVADNVFSRASRQAIAAVDAQLPTLQPPLISPATGWAPMTAPLYTGSGPNINDGGQNKIEDCYFHAELLAIAAVSPSTIQNQIHPNANGTYSVKLYDAHSQPIWITITADLPTDGTADPYEFVTKGAWAALYEKAFAQLHGGYGRITATGVQGLLIDGFAPIIGIEPTVHQEPSLIEVAQAVARRQPVVISTVTDVSAALQREGTINVPVDILDATGTVVKPQVRDGLHYDHNYVVQSVDPKAGTVTLINPWGWSAPTPRILVHWAQPTGDPFTPIFPGDITLTVGKLPSNH